MLPWDWSFEFVLRIGFNVLVGGVAKEGVIDIRSKGGRCRIGEEFGEKAMFQCS